jgi:hypothetical protein
VARIRQWFPAVVTFALFGAAVALVQRLPLSDFRPFTMTIEMYQLLPEGSSAVLSGRVELRYQNRANWQIHNANDEYIYACEDGMYGHFERSGAFVITSPGYAYPCPAPARWIGYGIAWALPWDKTIEADHISYTNTGERVVFDRNTCLPLLYEVGPIGGAAVQRTVYTLVK